VNLLRQTIKTILREEWYLERYDKKLIDDEAFNKESILVNDDVKQQIKDWLKKMKLA
jgi:hypothetical protein